MNRDKEFTTITFDLNYKNIVVYIANFNIIYNIEIDSLRKVQMIQLKVDKAFKKVSSKFADFINIFLPNFIIKLLKYIEINNNIIELVNN